MSISNDQIYETLLDVKKDIGGLLATVEQHQLAFSKHVADDAILGASVAAINLQLAQQKGSAKVWGMIATGAGAASGVVAALVRVFTGHH